MKPIEKLAKTQKNKANGRKIAEIIWLSVGGAIMLCGIVCMVLSLIINNLGADGSLITNSPLYPLIKAQEDFKNWWNGWFFIKMSSFAGLGTWLVIISCAYSLIVLAVYASKQDVLEKKEKARKLREKNALKLKEQVASSNEDTSVENA